MCDIVDYLYMRTSWLSIICSSIVVYPNVDYAYCQLLITRICVLLYMCFIICVQVNMCDILRKRKAYYKKGMDHSEDFSNLILIADVLWCGQIMRDSWFVTVQNSQFSIQIRFTNNANRHICRICTRRLIFVSIR